MNARGWHYVERDLDEFERWVVWQMVVLFRHVPYWV